MKIFRIIARLNVGGPARHVVWLTKELADDEFDSVLIAGTVPPGEEDMGYFAAANDVEPLYLQELSRELSPKDLISLFKIYRRMLAERPDVIHTHTAKAGTVGRSAAFMYRWLTWGTLIGRPRKVRIVHTFHGHVFHSYYGETKTRLFLAIEKLLARIATDRIIVISDQQLSEIGGKFGVGRTEQFRVIPLGIDLEAFSVDEGVESLREQIGAADQGLIVGFVGRLTEIKNVPMLLEAAAIGLKLMPGLRFVIVGDGHLRGELESRLRELGIGGEITFLGNRNDTEKLYAGMDIVALTSSNEGTPLSLIESMAAGRAVISTGVGGVVDLLGRPVQDHGRFQVCERGIRVDSSSAADFAEGLIYLAKDEKLRKQLGENGKIFVRENYSRERLFRDIKDLYRELVHQE